MTPPTTSARRSAPTAGTSCSEDLPKEALMFDLAGRTALVTGAASGIGAGTARGFAQAGGSVVQDASKAAGGRCLTAAVDVRRTADVDAIVEQAVAEFGRIDIVVANAG